MPTKIRIATFNIRYGTAKDGANAWPNRKNAVADMVRKHGGKGDPRPTLFGLQEAEYWQYQELLGLLGDEWCGVFAGRNDWNQSGEGTAFVWKKADLYCTGPPTMFALSDEQHVAGSQWNRLEARHPRFVLQARFLVLGQPGGVDGAVPPTFDAWVTHFDYSTARVRDASAELVVSRLPNDDPSRPLFFLGDLNAPASEPGVALLRSAMTDSMVSVHGPKSDMIGTFHGFQGNDWGPLHHIDYIFFRGKVKVESCEIDRSSYPDGKLTQRWPSDHFPVICNYLIG